MNVPLVLPILIPFLTAALLLLGWRHLWLQRGLGLVGALALLGTSIQLLWRVHSEGIQVAQMGSWPAPFGITLIADHFSALMILVTGILAVATAIYSLADIDEPRQRHGYFPLMHIMLMGVCGAFLAGDIFNMYVWFEVLLISSFVLMALGSEKAQMEGALKYVTLNLISSFLFLTSAGILYGVTGTLNLADLAMKIPQLDNPPLVTTIAMLFLLAFGIKSAVFPLYSWLPASYHTPPAAVSAIFAGLLTKVGVYALIRVFTLLFIGDLAFTHTLLLVIGGLTMLSGVLGAIAQNELRRILSAHIVSQIGYMVMGLGLFTPLGLAGAIFYIFHHILVKANLFLVSGIIHKVRGSYDLDWLGDLYRQKPWLAACFAVPALSLGGIPPLSGFIAKLSIIRAGLESEQYLITGVALVVGLLTLYSMSKIWIGAFWKPGPEESPVRTREPLIAQPGPEPSRGELALLVLPCAGLGLITIMLGVLAGPCFEFALTASDELLNREQYIRAVLGDQP